MRALQDIVEPYSLGRILAVGGLVTAAPAAGLWWAVGWGDVALGAAAIVAAAATSAAAVSRHRLDALPLALAPLAARGRVDGRVAVRFRACLGRGRSCRPRMEVTFHPTDGPPVELPVTLGSPHVCGPFVGLVEAPQGQGAYEVEVRAAAEVARARYEPEQVVDGRFDAGIAVGRRVRFDGEWAHISPADG